MVWPWYAPLYYSQNLCLKVRMNLSGIYPLSMI